MIEGELLERLNAGEFEAVDFGCGAGGSTAFIKKRLGFSRVLGIDSDSEKLAASEGAGHVVLRGDVREFNASPKVVSAVFMFHFLEHLPSLEEARTVLGTACTLARDYVLIRQPFFGADERLLESGLKLAWSTWKEHPTKMTTLDFLSILTELAARSRLSDFSISYAIPIESTADTQVLPLLAGSDERTYDLAKHGPKPMVPLADVYREICVVIRLGSSVPVDSLEQAARVVRRVYPRSGG